MRKYRVEILVGVVFLLLYFVFCAWHSPWSGKLAPSEIDEYMVSIERLPLPPEEVSAISSRIRAWAEADDGEPVYMLNLMRYFPELRKFAGTPEFAGSPEEANAYYERSIMGLWLSRAAYPAFAGATQGQNLIDMQPQRSWERVAIVRYPNRRTFLKLLSDPRYAPVEPYKFMAVELDLAPVSGALIVPDLRWIVGGGFIVVFLLVGWVRAARRATASQG